MATQVNNGIKVRVKTQFEPNYSNPGMHQYFFSYTIRIENTNEFSVQLLRRHWYIFDSNGSKHEVDGEGVVGETPVLAPGESFAYDSGCNLRTSMGSMHGYYTFVRLFDNSSFEVEIPKFTLTLPELLN